MRHPLLEQLATDADVRAFATFGRSHYALVVRFTRYLELLLLAAPDSEAKLWIARVLVDEYGGGSDGADHPALYRRFLDAVGVGPGEVDASAALPPAIAAFVDEHVAMTRDGPFLVGLGAIGPGHEWSIPAMFAPVVEGLRRLACSDDALAYFTLHREQDVDHGAWLEEALAGYATTDEARVAIRHGALRSLEARARVWDAIEHALAGPVLG